MKAKQRIRTAARNAAVIAQTIRTYETEQERNIYKLAQERNLIIKQTTTNLKQTRQIALVENENETYGVIETTKQGNITNNIKETTKEKANEIARYLQTN